MSSRSSGSTSNAFAFTVPNLSASKWAEANQRAREFERIQRDEEHRRRLKASCIPESYLEADIGKCNAVVSEWARFPDRDLIIQGETGRGKTYSACAALLSLMDDYRVLFATFDGVLDEIRATYGSRGSEIDVKDRYSNVGILCIDDLGKTRPTEWCLPILHEIVDRRTSSHRRTVITTQYADEELASRLFAGDDRKTAHAIMSRLRGAVRVTLGGPDRRESWTR